MVSHYAKRRDLSEPDIVDALEKAGCKVYRALPVDLLVRVPRDPPGVLRTLECKTNERKDGTAKLDKRQKEQAEFCALTGTPYVTTAEQALREVGL